MDELGERKISLDNPLWQFLSFAIAAFSFLLYLYSSYDAFFINRPKRSLKIEIAHCTSIVPIDKPAPKGLEIFYDGKKIDKASVIGIRLLNSGNRPILKNDYANPIRLKLPSTVDILSADIHSSQPLDLNPKVLITNNSEITLSPLLMNPLDFFEIELLALNLPQDLTDKIYVSGRITGVNNLSISEQDIRDNILSAINRAYHTEAIIVIPISMIIIFIILWYWPKCWYYIEQIFGKQPYSKWPRFSLNIFLAAIAAIVLEDIVEGVIEIAKAFSWF